MIPVRSTLCVSLLVSGLAGAPPALAQEHHNDTITRDIPLHRQQVLEGAPNHLREIGARVYGYDYVEEYVPTPQDYLNEATRHLQNGDYVPAYEAINKAANRAPQHPDVRQRRLEIYRAIGIL